MAQFIKMNFQNKNSKDIIKETEVKPDYAENSVELSNNVAPKEN